MAPTPVLVPDADIRKLAEYLAKSPGAVILTQNLYSRYETLVRADNRVPQSQRAFSRALSRCGWQSTSVRKSRGPRGKQVHHFSGAWVVPGAPLIPVEDERMVTTLRALLADNDALMVRSVDIWEGYQRQAQQHGWAWTMGRSQVTAWLNRHGFARLTEGGKHGRGGWRGELCRYVAQGQLDAIYPLNGPERV